MSPKSPTPEMETFQEFWPFYLGEHSLASTRRWHFVGTHLALITLFSVVLIGRTELVPIALVFGYGPAWYSHFFIEKNRPATFKHPLWSLRADFKMAALMWRGCLEDELQTLSLDKSTTQL